MNITNDFRNPEGKHLDKKIQDTRIAVVLVGISALALALMLPKIVDLAIIFKSIGLVVSPVVLFIWGKKENPLAIVISVSLSASIVIILALSGYVRPELAFVSMIFSALIYFVVYIAGKTTERIRHTGSDTNVLPKTPVESLNTSPVITGIIGLVHFFVGIFGIWKYPMKNTSANFEEMSFMDKIYWAYKSKNMIKMPGKEISVDNFHRGLKYTRHEIENKGVSITIGAAGDLIKNSLIRHSGDSLYEHISDYLFSKDISTANLESLLSGGKTGSYKFSVKNTPSLHCTEQQFNVLKGFRDQQYSLLNIANNHSLDEGISAFYHTAVRLKEEGTAVTGINFSPEKHGTCLVLKKKGFKIGFISATYGLNGKEIPPDYDHAVNIEPFHNKVIKNAGKKKNLENQLGHAKQQGCHFVIAHLHWGYEYELYPRSLQIKRARELAEAGVDLIISHHPHVIQPSEIYTPENAPHKRTLITYSLGNLTSNYSAPCLRLSTILNVKLTSGTVQGKKGLYIHDAEFIPVVQTETEKDGKRGIKIIRFEEVPEKNNEMNDIINRVFKL